MWAYKHTSKGCLENVFKIKEHLKIGFSLKQTLDIIYWIKNSAHSRYLFTPHSFIKLRVNLHRFCNFGYSYVSSKLGNV